MYLDKVVTMSHISNDMMIIKSIRYEEGLRREHLLINMIDLPPALGFSLRVSYDFMFVENIFQLLHFK